MVQRYLRNAYTTSSPAIDMAMLMLSNVLTK